MDHLGDSLSQVIVQTCLSNLQILWFTCPLPGGVLWCPGQFKEVTYVGSELLHQCGKEKQFIHSHSPATCNSTGNLEMREEPFLFLKYKISSFLPFFSFPPTFPSFLPLSLLFFFSPPLSLLYSSFLPLEVDGIRNFLASTKVILSPWWIHSTMLIFQNLSYGGLWLKGLVLRKKISTSFFQVRERDFVHSLRAANLLISSPCWLEWWSLFFWHCLSDT